MDDLRLDPGGSGRLAVDLIPGEDFVRHDVEGMPDRRSACEQADEADGKVAVVGDGPERGSVAGDDDLLAGAHPRDGGVGQLPAVDAERDLRVAISERRPDDRHRKPGLAILAHQPLFAGDLVPRVIPERVGERRVFANDPVAERLEVGAGRADEDELAGPVAKEPDVALDIFWCECDPVHDGVEPVSGECAGCRRLVVCVGEDRGCAAGAVWVAAAVQQVQVDAPLNRQPSGRGADETRAADE